MPVWLGKLVVAHRFFFGTRCWGWQKAEQSLTPAFDSLDCLICAGPLLLVVSSLFQFYGWGWEKINDPSWKWAIVLHGYILSIGGDAWKCLKMNDIEHLASLVLAWCFCMVGISYFFIKIVMLLKWWSSIRIFIQIWKYSKHENRKILSTLLLCRQLCWIFAI
jgi:hypothetical protein